MTPTPATPSVFGNEFDDICPQIIFWQPLLSRDQYGAPTWDTPQYFYGRRVFKNQRVAAYERGTKGQGPEVLSSSQIIILNPLTLSYDDIVAVVGDNAPYPPILSWGRNPDETGLDVMTKVWLGSANG